MPATRHELTVALAHQRPAPTGCASYDPGPPTLLRALTLLRQLAQQLADEPPRPGGSVPGGW